MYAVLYSFGKLATATGICKLKSVYLRRLKNVYLDIGVSLYKSVWKEVYIGVLLSQRQFDFQNRHFGIVHHIVHEYNVYICIVGVFSSYLCSSYNANINPINGFPPKFSFVLYMFSSTYLQNAHITVVAHKMNGWSSFS